jgi:hypothetical protein
LIVREVGREPTFAQPLRQFLHEDDVASAGVAL